MNSMRNIFRLNKPFNDVDGFRVTIVHTKYKFEQIYHDKEYGGFEAALQAAKTVRDYVSEQLYIRPEQLKEIYAEAHALMPPPYPCRRRRISSIIDTNNS